MDFVARTPAQYRIEPGDPLLTYSGGSAENTAEATPLSPEEAAGEAVSQVRKDLYLSFMVGQSNDGDQNTWLRAVASYYHSVWPKEKLEQLPAVVERMDDTIVAMTRSTPDTTTPQADVRTSRMRVPPKHAPRVDAEAQETPSMTREKQFEKHWGNFKKWIEATEPRAQEDNKQLALPAEEVAKLAQIVARGDTIYQGRPRSGGYIFDKDPHASLFRKHIIEGISTGSEAYDGIFSTIRSLCEKTAKDEQLRSNPKVAGMLEAIAQLREDWQANHPDQVFEQPNTPALSPTALRSLGELAASAAYAFTQS